MQITRKFCLESGWVMEFSEMGGGGGAATQKGGKVIFEIGEES